MQSQPGAPGEVRAIVDAMAAAATLAGATGVGEQHAPAIAVRVAVLAMVTDEGLVLGFVKLEGIAAVERVALNAALTGIVVGGVRAGRWSPNNHCRQVNNADEIVIPIHGALMSCVIPTAGSIVQTG